ncbi:nuclear protein [Cryptococcus neoformans]|nr:nuclear protein [Cryptococcus neoformans var. grubii Th84]OXH15788.1 nuclear protein [Cryptococcus neoformans var. grubii]OXH36084.1 nuclear protein [Cryptococcus neoformans var. grubii]OXH56880.1 nuclear protein [Cryptococcus neoformans var. grubii]OXH56994.1 nuclear protein [Cryptococcus neoformans var. grubii]
MSNDESKETQQQAPLKRRRITRACDRCHRGGIRCASSSNPSVCAPCADFGSECTYNRPMKRRGPPPSKARESHGSSSGIALTRWTLPLPSDNWIYREVASHAQIETLVEAYYAIVYPIYPMFHWPTFTANIRRRVYTTYPAFHALTMSVCAIASARLRDGAVPSPNSSTPTSDSPPPTSETFYQAAVASYPRDITTASDFDYKRAKPLLATLAIQYGQIPAVHAHIGDYMTLCAIDGFHNESRWPNDLNEIEVQERRRLFWLAYQLDVYAATTWGAIIRHRESQSTVLYPAEVYSDEEITPTGIVKSVNPAHPVSFWRGWNFVVDLYRILEHAVTRLRARNHTFDAGNQIAALFSEGRVGSGTELKPGDLLLLVERLYRALPPELRATSEMTGDVETDRYGFQAANILVTMQTMKMVVAGMAEWSVEQRCSIAGELLDAFATVPRAYIQAISTPLLHHLAGVGHLLASIIHSPLSPAAYLHVRTVLLSMADLLSSLESHLTSTGGIAPKLREHVERIDRYMTTATESNGKLVTIASTIHDAQTRQHLATPHHAKATTPAIPFPLGNIGAVSGTAGNVADTGSSGMSTGTNSSNVRTTSRPSMSANADVYNPSPLGNANAEFQLKPSATSSSSSLPVPHLSQPPASHIQNTILPTSSSSVPRPMHLPFGGIGGGVGDIGAGESLQRREPSVITPSSSRSSRSTPPQFSPRFVDTSLVSHPVPPPSIGQPQGNLSDLPLPLQPSHSQNQSQGRTPHNQSQPLVESPFHLTISNFPPESQQPAYQLPDDLFVDWPFLFNEFGFQGDAFDFLSSSIGGGGGGTGGEGAGAGVFDGVQAGASGSTLPVGNFGRAAVTGNGGGRIPPGLEGANLQ